ncbi:hypothetical protein [Streptomyces sp. ST2-7A]|uniref:hypothetical protein n=1 Tax=Streptomyces sp. ST2-7A TaxID=2907214 RepID=UPI001F48E66A|nr:hypothetical protein [Streptomyces sp. ST2-7A]MCE7081188.1 hypothetical protein [Streptomyces sp. ST2-7A]
MLDSARTAAAWATDHPVPAALAALLALALVALAYVTARAILRATLTHTTRAARALRTSLTGTPRSVIAAAIAAAICTAYSADVAWRFAAKHLEMDSVEERVIMFAAGEIALFATALMARDNVLKTGVPGTPGTLMWVITGAQILPCFMVTESIAAGAVRAFFGPVAAGLLWHLAMGIELRHTAPEIRPNSLPAILLREARERLLSYLGVATRNRSAEQIARDRATHRAVAYAARRKALDHRRLVAFRRLRESMLDTRTARAVARADVGVDDEQREVLMKRLAVFLNAGQLAGLNLSSPWQPVTDAVAPTVSLEKAPAPDARPAAVAPSPSPAALPVAPTTTAPVGGTRRPVLPAADVPAVSAVSVAPTPDTRRHGTPDDDAPTAAPAVPAAAAPADVLAPAVHVTPTTATPAIPAPDATAPRPDGTPTAAPAATPTPTADGGTRRPTPDNTVLYTTPDGVEYTNPAEAAIRPLYEQLNGGRPTTRLMRDALLAAGLGDSESTARDARKRIEKREPHLKQRLPALHVQTIDLPATGS